MKKKILIIGGSYFIGRVFCILAGKTGDYALTVMNRGNVKINNPEITEIVCDRHDPGKMDTLLGGNEYDAVVDFCAYMPGDAVSLLNTLKGRCGHYIGISSASVLQPSSSPRAEDFPQIHDLPANPVEEYSYNKMLLEKEVASTAIQLDIPYTILRPCIVYGPMNYAPRESYYFNLLEKGDPIPTPTDIHTKFQFIYVKDIAKIIMRCIGGTDLVDNEAVGNEAVHNKTYNLAAPEEITYDRWTEFLGTLGYDLRTEPVTLEEVLKKNIPIPFPVECNERFRGDRIAEDAGIQYTSFDEGMRETYDLYMLGQGH
jgi:nucleoside-diphosphate-sugar epimerase